MHVGMLLGICLPTTHQYCDNSECLHGAGCGRACCNPATQKAETGGYFPGEEKRNLFLVKSHCFKEHR